MANKGEKPGALRAGKRKDRNKRVGKRVPELGYYLIVTDTEENYFEGLRDSIPEELRDACHQGVLFMLQPFCREV